MNLDISTLSTPMLIGLGITIALQLVLAVISLIVLARTPRERLVFEQKWLWVLLIVLISFIGAILFFVIGRRPAPTSDPHLAGSVSGKVAQTVQNLYGGDQP